MHRLNRILVALDGSSSSFRALEEAIRLAQWGRSGVTVITVAPPYEGDLSLVGVKNIRAAMQGPAEDILLKAVEIAEAKGFPIRAVCEEGEADRKIIEQAERLGIDLIVLGASTRKPALRSLPGGTGSKVVARSPTNVLVLPEPTALRWEGVLLVTEATSYGQVCMEAALELVASFGGKVKAITLLAPAALNRKGNREAEPGMEALRGMAEAAGAECTLHTSRGGSGRIVKDAAEKHEADLIVAGIENRTRFFGLFPAAISKQLIRHTHRPVFWLRPPIGPASRSRGQPF